MFEIIKIKIFNVIKIEILKVIKIKYILLGNPFMRNKKPIIDSTAKSSVDGSALRKQQQIM